MMYVPARPLTLRDSAHCAAVFGGSLFGGLLSAGQAASRLMWGVLIHRVSVGFAVCVSLDAFPGGMWLYLVGHDIRRRRGHAAQRPISPQSGAPPA